MDFALTAVSKKVPEGYIALVEELPGANTQGRTLEEARENLREAVELVLDANCALARATRKVSTVPRHREVDEQLARKICRDLEVPPPRG